MGTKVITTALAVAFSAFALTNLPAQEIIHATTATVIKVDTPSSSLIVRKANQSTTMFQIKQPLTTKISFDPALHFSSMTTDMSLNPDTNIIIYYFGFSTKVVVAVKDLGKEALNVTGIISLIDKGEHAISVTGDNGTQNVCYITKDTAVETSLGVVLGSKYSPKKGQKVKMVCTQESGKQTAQFIEPM